MFRRRRRIALATACLVALMTSGCASAAKRYEQGHELEQQGRFDEAGWKYVEALQKDPSLQEARSRLNAVGTRAISDHFQDARVYENRGDAVGAATSMQRIDAMVGRARSVGVRLELPADYDQQRRARFDAAIEALLDNARSAQARGAWPEGINSTTRARRDFEASARQHDDAIALESNLLVDWSHQELRAGRLQSAFARASQVPALDGVPRATLDDAEMIMDEALALGQVEVMALPIVMNTPRDRRQDAATREALRDLEIRVNDALDRGPWRDPHPFVRMSDPVEVRDVVRQAGVLQGGVRSSALGLLLRIVDGDFGAWLEVADVQSSEFEVRRTDRAVQTHDGRATSFVLEEGQRRMQVQARVIVVDRFGNEVTNTLVVGDVTAPFRRGVYDGDPRELNLHRRDVDAFDAVTLLQQDQKFRQAVAEDLAGKLARTVLDPVVARIP